MSVDSRRRTGEGLLEDLMERLVGVERRMAMRSLIPTGATVGYVGAVAPDGWLFQNGASVLRVAYPALFALSGTTYGAADADHFNLPTGTGIIKF